MVIRSSSSGSPTSSQSSSSCHIYGSSYSTEDDNLSNDGSSGSSHTRKKSDGSEDSYKQHLYPESPTEYSNHSIFNWKKQQSEMNGLTPIANTVITLPMPSSFEEEHRQHRYPYEPSKTLWAVLIFLVGSFTSSLSLAITHDFVPYGTPLPDITHSVDLVPWGLLASEYLITIMMSGVILMVSFHRYSLIVLRRILLIMGILYFYRAITMYITVLPPPLISYYCAPRENVTSVALYVKRAFHLMSGFGLSSNGKHVFCGDYFFSGHTCTFVICYYAVSDYSPRRWWPLHWVMCFLCALGVVILQLGRGHYTLDVVAAYYISSRMWNTYHTIANTKDLKTNRSNNFLSRIWWYPILVYFEGNVSGSVPRKLNLPTFMWHKRVLSKFRQKILNI